LQQLFAMFGFGSGKSKEERLKEDLAKWSKELRANEHEVERELRHAGAAEEKAKREAKEYARKYGAKLDTTMSMMLKNVLQARKMQARLHVAKANIQSVGRQLKTQAGEWRRAGRAWLPRRPSGGVTPRRAASPCSPARRSPPRSLGQPL